MITFDLSDTDDQRGIAAPDKQTLAGDQDDEETESAAGTRPAGY